jgi:hypothetical protein
MIWPALFTQTKPPSGSTRPWTETLFCDVVFPELHHERCMRVSAFLAALLLALIVGAGIFLLPIKSTIGPAAVASLDSLSWLVRLAAILGILVTIFAIFVNAKAFCRIRKPPTADKCLAPTSALFALVGTAFGVVLVVNFIKSEWWQPPALAMLSFIRAANLGNGVSPLKPLIFLGIANLCLIGGDLWRLRLLEDCRVNPPFLNFEPGAESFRGVDALESQVIHFLECGCCLCYCWSLSYTSRPAADCRLSQSTVGPSTLCSFSRQSSSIPISRSCCSASSGCGLRCTACCDAFTGIRRGTHTRYCA